MSNYTATVVKIDNLRVHENADRLLCTNIFGNNVIVGKDTKEGDIGLFFPLEAQLGKEFAEANDLIRRRDENGKPAGGMFDKSRRVRAQTFRGEKSMGFFCPLEYLHKLTPEDAAVLYPAVGTEIETYWGFDISKKYVVPARTQGAPGSKKGKKVKESKIIPEQFHFHFDTAQLGKNIHKIVPDSLIAITWKLHGTSGIVGNVMVKKKLSLVERACKAVGLQVVDTEYDYVYASRKIIKNDALTPGFYNEDIWTEAGKQFKDHLHKGEQVYYELVGYTSSGQEIQKGYDYGCKPSEFAIYIYRITQTNADGVVTELPWHQVKHRAMELGFETCPEIYYGGAYDSAFFDFATTEEWGSKFLNHLQKEYVYDQDSQFCKNKVPEEGIVVRVENGDGIENFKLKSFKFLQHESKFLDKGEIDIESGETDDN